MYSGSRGQNLIATCSQPNVVALRDAYAHIIGRQWGFATAVNRHMLLSFSGKRGNIVTLCEYCSRKVIFTFSLVGLSAASCTKPAVTFWSLAGGSTCIRLMDHDRCTFTDDIRRVVQDMPTVAASA